MSEWAGAWRIRLFVPDSWMAGARDKPAVFCILARLV